ncbi:MAG: DUF5716 family protein [Acholeplasmatales bacterium]|nr:DUF5716 family protein [Acholeplasmatales bacterium]
MDALFIIYNNLDSVEDNFQGERELIIERLENYFIYKNEDLVDEENISHHTARQKASSVIRTLINTGWVGEEELGNYRTSINLYDHSIIVLEALEKIINGNKLEYTSEISAISALINAYDEDDDPLGILEQAYEKTISLNRRLRSLKANIYRYYYDITREKNANILPHILEKLLIEYKNNFFDLAYFNLKTKDSLPKHKRIILKRMYEIGGSDVRLDILAKKVVDYGRITDYDTAFNYIVKRISTIRDSFENLENLMGAIDKKNEQYIGAATNKILFLTSNTNDVEGLFNKIFKIVVDSNESVFNYNELFNFTHSRNLDTESLYTERKDRVFAQIDEIDYSVTIPEYLMQEKTANLFKSSIYGKHAIDRYVLLLLEDKTEVESKNLILETIEDYTRLILIFLYSRANGIHYCIEVTEEVVNNGYARYKNFIIRRK